MVWNRHKRAEKLRYMHRNCRGPGKPGFGLLGESQCGADWWPRQNNGWSSYRAYAYEENGPVLVNEQQPVRLKWKGAPVSVHHHHIVCGLVDGER